MNLFTGRNAPEVAVYGQIVEPDTDGGYHVNVDGEVFDNVPTIGFQHSPGDGVTVGFGHSAANRAPVIISGVQMGVLPTAGWYRLAAIVYPPSVRGIWPQYEGQPEGIHSEAGQIDAWHLVPSNPSSLLCKTAVTGTTFGFVALDCGYDLGNGSGFALLRTYLDSGNYLNITMVRVSGYTPINPTPNAWSEGTPLQLQPNVTFNLSGSVASSSGPPYTFATGQDQGNTALGLVVNQTDRQIVVMGPNGPGSNDRARIWTLSFDNLAYGFSLVHVGVLPRTSTYGVTVANAVLICCAHTWPANLGQLVAYYPTQTDSPYTAWCKGTLGYTTTVTTQTSEQLVTAHTRKGGNDWNAPWKLDPASLSTVGKYVTPFVGANSRFPFCAKQNALILTVCAGSGLNPASAVDRYLLRGAFPDEPEDEFGGGGTVGYPSNYSVDLTSANNQIQFVQAAFDQNGKQIWLTRRTLDRGTTAATVDSQSVAYYLGQPITGATSDHGFSPAEGNPTLLGVSVDGEDNCYVAAYNHFGRHGTFPLGISNSSYNNLTQLRSFSYDTTDSEPSVVVEPNTCTVVALIAEPHVVLLGCGNYFAYYSSPGVVAAWRQYSPLPLFRTLMGVTPFGGTTSWYDLSDVCTGDTWDVPQNGLGPPPTNSTNYEFGEEWYRWIPFSVPAVGIFEAQSGVFFLRDYRLFRNNALDESQPIVEIRGLDGSLKCRIPVCDTTLQSSGSVHQYTKDWRSEPPTMKGGVDTQGRAYVEVWTYGADRATPTNPNTVRFTTIVVDPGSGGITSPTVTTVSYPADGSSSVGTSSQGPCGPLNSGLSDGLRKGNISSIGELLSLEFWEAAGTIYGQSPDYSGSGSGS